MTESRSGDAAARTLEKNTSGLRRSLGTSPQEAQSPVNMSEESVFLSGNAPVRDDTGRMAVQARPCGRAGAGEHGAVAIDALKRQFQVELADEQLFGGHPVPQPHMPPLRCVCAIGVRPVASVAAGVGAGNCSVPAEATMDPSALAYCVMSLGRERQTVVSGQCSGYSSRTHPPKDAYGVRLRHSALGSPRVRFNEGNEPYVRQPWGGAVCAAYTL